jgi:tetratricopeptide (TPR) repeat protein
VKSEEKLIYYQRGQSYQSLQDYQGAIEDYTQAIRLDCLICWKLSVNF